MMHVKSKNGKVDNILSPPVENPEHGTGAELQAGTGKPLFLRKYILTIIKSRTVPSFSRRVAQD